MTKTNNSPVQTHCGRCCRPLTICMGTCPRPTIDVATMAALNSINLTLPARKARRGGR